jgi:hypothetical protein
MGIFTDILKEIPLSAVLRERLTDAETKMAALEQENASLKTQVASLTRDLQQARGEIEAQQQFEQSDLVPFKGALWKRKPGGGYFDDVLCRECHNPMVSSHGVLSYVCVPCDVRVNFTGRQLAQVMRDLP